MGSTSDDVSVTATAPVLFNCLRRERDVFVKVGNEFVVLPRGPKPTLVDSAVESCPLVVRLSPSDDATFELRSSDGRCDMTLGMPPALPGALFLVDSDVLLRHPDRDDLVTPASYGANFGGESDVEPRSFLVAVHRVLLPVSDGVVNVDLDDFD